MHRRVPWTIAAFVLATAPAAGQEAVGPQIPVNDHTVPAWDFYPSVAADAAGRFVVVWGATDDTYGPLEHVYGRRFDRAGNALGAPFLVSTSAEEDAGARVAAAPAGAFVVAWASRAEGSETGVFARRYDASGKALDDAPFLVNAHTTDAQEAPDVAADAAGNFVVVWQGSGPGGADEVMARRYDASGAPLTAEFVVNATTTGFQGAPAVAMAADGRFVVTWTGVDGFAAGVFARPFDAEGTPSGDELQVNTTTLGNQYASDVALDAAGRFVVVWQSNASAAYNDIFARRFDAAGVPLGGEFQVNTYTTGQQRLPSVASDPEGHLLVAWTNAPASDVSGQRYAPGGAGVGGEFRVNAFSTGNQARPAVAAAGAEKYVAAWDGWGPLGTTEIFAQRFGDLIFKDDFETGGTARWSFVQDGGGDLVLGPGLASTALGLQGNVDDVTSLFVQDAGPLDEDRYRVRFYFDTGDFDPGEALAHRRTRIFVAFQESPTRRLMAAVLRRLNGQYAVMARARQDDNSQADTGFFPISPGPHWIELDWRRSSGPDALDGRLEMWLDGVSVRTLTGLDNSVSAVDFARLGALSLKSGASGSLRWDQFESRRELRIGP